VSNMKALLDDVLAVGKSESPIITPKVKQVDLIAFLRQVMIEVAEATNHTHVFVTDFHAAATYVSSDEKLLRNIFINLLSNAVKFSPVKKEVRVKVATTSNRVVVTVQDFGIGIAHQELEKVFVPFNRGSNTGNIQGTGLGLSIVKKAVEALGGTISVTSQLNIGTTFTVSFKKEA